MARITRHGKLGSELQTIPLGMWRKKIRCPYCRAHFKLGLKDKVVVWDRPRQYGIVCPECLQHSRLTSILIRPNGRVSDWETKVI